MKLQIYFILTIYFLIPEFLTTEVDLRCTKQFCEDYRQSPKCREMVAYCRKNPDSTRFLYPDTCNCCELCVKNLKFGEDCYVGRPGASIPTEMCGPGLQCTPENNGKATCQRIDNVCTRAQDEYDKRKEEGDMGMTEVRPECDDDGFFKPVHCIPGYTCYCLSTLGDRIFGEMPYLSYEDEAKMTCGCAINAWKAERTLDPSFPISVARCTSIGSFDQLQCMDGPEASCLCIDAETGSPLTDIADVVAEENMGPNNPVCFDESIHTPGKHITPCEEELEVYLSYSAKQQVGDEDDEFQMTKPFCQPDGKFDRIQYSGTRMVCVDPDGREIEQYGATIGTPEAATMDCKCARTRWLLERAKVVALPKCCATGNFEAWQCRRNECFCVDANGNQMGLEVTSKDVAKLKCYRQNGGNACPNLPKQVSVR